MTALWQLRPQDPDLARRLSDQLHVHPAVAQTLINRGITEAQTAKRFWNPSLSDLAHPFDLPGAEEAADYLAEAVIAGRRIGVYGDYDADGITSTAVLINFLGLNGPSTANPRPTLIKPANVSQGPGFITDAVTGMLDWWEKVHILPRAKIQFGIIITQQSEDYEIYSAFRTTDITLTSIVNNALPGVSLPDESPAELVPAQSSMLDAATTDNTGDAFVLGTEVLRSVIAEELGLPQFDTTIEFNFSSGDAPQLFVSGIRIVLMPMEYEAPVKETLAFLTDIITALSGKEQRIALRKNPRQLFEVTYKLDTNDRQRMQALLMDWMGNAFGFPVQADVLYLTAAVSVGGTAYSVAGADDVDIRNGGLAVAITDANTFDVIQIGALTDTLITANDPSVNAYPVGTRIYPVRVATILKTVTGARSQNNLETFKIIFEVSDNDTGVLTASTAAYSTYNGRVLFDDCNVVTGDMSEQFKMRVYRVDGETGRVARTTTWDRGKRGSQKGFVLRSRAEIMDFRRVMLAIEGRVKAFYIPTFIADLEVTANLTIGTDTVDIARIEYERHIQARIPKTVFKITFTDDTSLVRTVLSAAGVDSDTERLTVDDTWPANRTVAEIVRIQFYELSRFDSDSVVINYPRIGLADSRMPVMQVFDDNA